MPRHRLECRRSVRARPHSQPVRAALGERSHRREVAAPAVEERVVAARHLRTRRRHAGSDLGELLLPERVVVRGAGAERGQLRLDALEHGVEPADRLAEDAHRGIEEIEDAGRE